ncbi:tautomerase family protein, partial [Xanthomonas perforans]|uniref:tautomerase family protein n=1 Tax=Xanthomonas perforans TaxID=442694 RepID=UPI001F30595C
MPLINIKVSASSSPALTAKISTQVSDLTSRILGKKAGLIATIITYVRPEDWLIGGMTLSEIAVSSFSLEIILTVE